MSCITHSMAFRNIKYHYEKQIRNIDNIFINDGKYSETLENLICQYQQYVYCLSKSSIAYPGTLTEIKIYVCKSTCETILTMPH